MKLTAKITLASGLLAIWALGGTARAGQIPGAPVLQPVSVNGQLAISALAYSQTLTAPGTKFLNPPIFVPGGNGVATAACNAAGFCDFGTGEISATLGADPTILLSAKPANNGGGDSFLSMSYEVEYYDPAATAGTVVNPALQVSDILDSAGLSAAEADMTISGANGVIYSAYDCQAAAGAAFGCNPIAAPFPDQQPLNMVANTVYTVDMDVEIYAHDPVSATIDPIFIMPKGGVGEFLFSPGITDGGGVPEPAAWALMLAGFGGLGALIRRRRATTLPAAAV